MTREPQPKDYWPDLPEPPFIVRFIVAAVIVGTLAICLFFTGCRGLHISIGGDVTPNKKPVDEVKPAPAPAPPKDDWAPPWFHRRHPKGLSISVPIAVLGDASAAVSMMLTTTDASIEAVPADVVSFTSFDEALSINNSIRIRAGKRPQSLDVRLCQVAQNQADWCADRNYTYHSRGSAHNFGNGELDVRAARYGFHGAIGENMAGNSDDIHGAFRQWQESSGHARTLYSNEYDRCGFGMAINARGERLYFAVYGRESTGAE